MAILPVRDLGSAGVITDTAPCNILIKAFSTGINVRFDEGKVRRAPIFRKPCANIQESEGQSGVHPTSRLWNSSRNGVRHRRDGL